MLSTSHAASVLPTPGSTSRSGRRRPCESIYSSTSSTVITSASATKRR